MEDAWFVRRRSAASYTINPISWQGWVVTAVYVITALALTPLAAAQRWVEWGALLALATLVFVVVAIRTSAPEKE